MNELTVFVVIVAILYSTWWLGHQQGYQEGKRAGNYEKRKRNYQPPKQQEL